MEELLVFSSRLPASRHDCRYIWDSLDWAWNWLDLFVATWLEDFYLHGWFWSACKLAAADAGEACEYPRSIWIGFRVLDPGTLPA